MKTVDRSILSPIAFTKLFSTLRGLPDTRILYSGEVKSGHSQGDTWVSEIFECDFGTVLIKGRSPKKGAIVCNPRVCPIEK